METLNKIGDLMERLRLVRLTEEFDGADDVSPDVDDPALVDMTAHPFVTIDNEDSRDLDQALYVEATDDGWIVRYAIADAAWFVRPGTELFDFALSRGASYYLLDLALPMLPRSLSEGVVSLNPEVDRRALVFETHLTSDGEAGETRVIRARIRSRAKLAYDGVQAWFDDGANGDEVYHDSLRAMRAVGEVRIERARRRGVIEFDRAEAMVSIEHDRFVLTVRHRNDVERWNEQLSLLCNTEGARLLSEAAPDNDELQSVYRVHLPPLETRLQQLRELIEQLRVRHNLDDSWTWDGDTRLSDYLSGLPAEPARVRRAVELQVRYTNRASEYSDRVGPHFALAVDQYARFSAPMREIVGIFTHKEALEALGFDEPEDPAADAELRARVIEAGNEAKQLQKKIDKGVMLLAIADFLREELDRSAEERPWRTATVIAVRPTRVYVLLDELPLELKLYTDDLHAAFGTEYSLQGYELIPGNPEAPSFGLGDEVSVRVAHYDDKRRRYSFDLR